MKKFLIIVLIISLELVLFTGCGSGNSGSKLTEDEQYVVDCVKDHMEHYSIDEDREYLVVSEALIIENDTEKLCFFGYNYKVKGEIYDYGEAVYRNGDYFMDAVRDDIPIDGSLVNTQKSITMRTYYYAEDYGYERREINIDKINKAISEE